ncbi:MAG: hypothetical protein NVSMB62_24230 [Acidobacteriaceae bacterium]
MVKPTSILFNLNEQGVEKDIEEALSWARSAAEAACKTACDFLEDAVAQFDLALSYLRGDGVKPDPKIAV